MTSDDTRFGAVVDSGIDRPTRIPSDDRRRGSSSRSGSNSFTVKMGQTLALKDGEFTVVERSSVGRAIKPSKIAKETT